MSTIRAESIRVGMPLSLSPATVEVRPGQQVTFSATGGSSPYEWSNSGGGMLTEIPGNGSSILYTAPEQLGIDWVTVEDDNGQTKRAKVSIRRN